ncbi:MAG: hypothetical protein K2G70_01500 [Turicibacter sp.]|nr:hypothetical protein [Turicibacter sp.]
MCTEQTEKYLKTYISPLQSLADKYNVSLGEVLEITELYLIINSTWDTLHLYARLNHYDNEELKRAISDFVCETF